MPRPGIVTGPLASRAQAGPAAIDRAGHSLSDKVEDIVREPIISGARQPGERLNEVEIAAELAVSRGPPALSALGERVLGRVVAGG